MIDLVERNLPANLEAERAILGAILLHSAAFPKVAAALKGEDFYRYAHQKIFEGMVALSARGVPLDLVTIKNELGRTSDLDEVGGPSYLAALVDGLPHSSNVEHYAAIVREKARLRGLIFAASKTAAEAYAADVPAAEVADKGMHAMLDFIETPASAITDAVTAVSSYVASLDRAATGDVMPTGLIDLDELLGGGIRPEEFIVLAGRPSAGKSSLGLRIARGLAGAGFPSAVFSLEMRTRMLAARLLSWQSRIDKDRITSRMLDVHDYARMAQAVESFAGVPLSLQDSATTLTEISAWCQRLRAEQGLKCAVVDYMQLLVPERRSNSREQEVSTISKGLRRIARTQGLAIVALSALNRSPEGRKDSRPRMSDLRESGAIESDADIVALLFRADQYDGAEDLRGIAEVIVAKNRDGATGVVKLVFIDAFGGLFENLARS